MPDNRRALFGFARRRRDRLCRDAVYQLLRYGVSVTTLLWILPYVVCGLIVGLYAQKRGFSSAQSRIIIVVIAELVVTTLNTGVMYIDSKIYGYYSAVYIFGSIAAATRYASARR